MIKVRYVQRVKGKDGQQHLYFRRGDHREGPLTNADGTQALADEIDAILERLSKAKAASKPRPGTVGGMLQAYAKSAKFRGLAQATQKDYQGRIDELIEDLGDHLLADVTYSWIRALLDAWSGRGHRAANLHYQVLKNALWPAIIDPDDARIKGDPFANQEKVSRPKDKFEPHPAWTAAEVEATIKEAIARKQPGLARAVALGRWAGFRRKTICKVPLRALLASHGAKRLYWVTEKRQVLCDKRADDRLIALLEATPHQALTIAYNADGHPWNERQLDQALNRLLTRLAKRGVVTAAVKKDGTVFSPLTLHGLRHARGVELAMTGASDAEIMAQLEHTSEQTARVYRRQAQRAHMADAAQDRIDQAIRLSGA